MSIRRLAVPLQRRRVRLRDQVVPVDSPAVRRRSATTATYPCRKASTTGGTGLRLNQQARHTAPWLASLPRTQHALVPRRLRPGHHRYGWAQRIDWDGSHLAPEGSHIHRLLFMHEGAAKSSPPSVNRRRVRPNYSAQPSILDESHPRQTKHQHDHQRASPVANALAAPSGPGSRHNLCGFVPPVFCLFPLFSRHVLFSPTPRRNRSTSLRRAVDSCRRCCDDGVGRPLCCAPLVVVAR